MGFERGKKLKLYGEILIWNRIRRHRTVNMSLKRVLIIQELYGEILLPMSITGLIEHEFEVMEKIAAAA